MKFEDALEDLKKLYNTRQDVAKLLQNHSLPIIIFGAGEMAKLVTEHLSKSGAEVSGYAVDDKYFKPNEKIFGHPLYRFSELRSQPDKCIFVLGMEDEMQGGNRAFEVLSDKDIFCYPLPINLKNSSEPVSIENIVNRRAEYEETFNLLEDEISRQTLVNYLKLKITGNYKWNLENYLPSPYFNVLKAPKIGGSYVDCGAYAGDTIGRYIKWSGGNYKKIFAIEANSESFTKMKNFVSRKNFPNVTLFNCGVYNEKGTLTFTEKIERSNISTSGTIKIDVDKLDNLIGNEKVDFIKIEVQGSEFQTLQGAESIITSSRPTIATMVFHKADELITIPQLLKNFRGDYKLYLRKHTRIRDNGLTFYAI